MPFVVMSGVSQGMGVSDGVEIVEGKWAIFWCRKGGGKCDNRMSVRLYSKGEALGSSLCIQTTPDNMALIVARCSLNSFSAVARFIIFLFIIDGIPL